MRTLLCIRCSSRTLYLLAVASIGALHLSADLSAQQTKDGRDSLENQISEALANVSLHRVKQGDAWNTLMELSRDEALSALLEIIDRNDTPMANSEARRFAYELLVKWNAADTKRGREILLNGIADSAVAAVAARGLLDSPESSRADSVDAIKAFIHDTSVRWQDRSNFIRRWLPDQEETARACESDLTEILVDQTDRYQVRWAAAAAIIRTSGPGRLIAKEDQLDSVGKKVVCWELAKYAAAEKGDWNAASGEVSADVKAAARRFVISTLHDADDDTRVAAMQTLGLVFGRDILVFKSENEYEWNPDYWGAIKDVAENDTDEVLRNGAGAVLSADIDAFAQRMKRKYPDIVSGGSEK